jgi:hypothetical protein
MQELNHERVSGFPFPVSSCFSVRGFVLAGSFMNNGAFEPPRHKGTKHHQGLTIIPVVGLLTNR